MRTPISEARSTRCQPLHVELTTEDPASQLVQTLKGTKNKSDDVSFYSCMHELTPYMPNLECVPFNRFLIPGCADSAKFCQCMSEYVCVCVCMRTGACHLCLRCTAACSDLRCMALSVCFFL